MSEPLRVVLVGAKREREEEVLGELHEVAEVALEANLTHALVALRQNEAHAAIIDLERSLEAGLATLRHLRTEEPRAHLIALTDELDSAVEAEAVRAGARDFVVAGDGTLRRVVAELAHGAGQRKGRIVTLFPTKGGVGATAIATNLAGILEARGGRTLLIDLRLALGDVEAFLDITARFTIADVLRLMRTLERDTLFASLTRHASGVDLLAQGDRVDEIDQITPFHVGRLLEFVTRHYDFVLLDGIHDFDEIALTALDVTDRLLLLVTQELPSLRNANRCLQLFEGLKLDPKKVSVVLNRYQKGVGMAPESIARHLRAPIAAVVANDYANMTAAIHRGVMVGDLAPTSALIDDLHSLAELVAS